MKQLKKKLLALAVIATTFLSSCGPDWDSPGNYYTFTGETIANFLENNSDEFSTFIQVLKRTAVWAEMQTYGHYTCFAPTNDAFENYFAEKGITINELDDKECDTIAWSHILSEMYYTTDLVEGAFPSPNLLDRYLSFSCDSDSISGNLFYLVNKTARLLERDDSCENGVVQIVNKVVEPSNKMLPDIMSEDKNISLFYKAMMLTNMNDSISLYIDDKYVAPGGDSCITGVYYHTGDEWEYAIFPEKRYYKYTVFAEPDEVFNRNGIYTLDDLIAYAKTVYDESYPADAGKYDDDYTNRRNPLNRFISYHFIEYYNAYNDFNVTNEDLVNTNFDRTNWDLEDFFEAMLPNSFMRIVTPKSGQIYINRKGSPAAGVTAEGVRIMTPSEIPVDQNALNGIYHYIDGILEYSNYVRTDVLNTRIRYDCTTLSPDFVNSGGRNRPGTTSCTGIKQGFCKNFTFSDETLLSIRNRHQWFWSYEGDEVILQGIYDATMKLPPVPFDGTYEIRIGYPVMASRGVIQSYFGQDPLRLDPCDIPLDLRIGGEDPRIGWVADTDNEAENRVNDKAMHNRGYMKAPASYCPSGGDYFRYIGPSMLRRILTTQYMSVEGEYYLRVRQLLDNNMAEMVYDYLEIVPKSVYASEKGEDIY